LVAVPGFIHLARQFEIFEANYGKHYGREQVTYRVYLLADLADDIERYGVLDNFSCFKFENYLNAMKELVQQRRLTHTVQQVCRRLSKRDNDSTPMNRDCADSGE